MTTMRTLLNRFAITRLGVALLAVVAAVAAPEARAQISTWTGGGGTASWSNASNWSLLPAVSSTGALRFMGATSAATINDRVTQTGTLSFFNNGSVGQTGTYTLSGSAIILRVTSSQPSVVTTTITGGGTPLQDTVNLDLELQTPTGSLQFFSINPGHDLLINGRIIGRGISKREGGTLTLTNVTSTFTAFSAAEGITRTPMLGLSGSASPLGIASSVGFGSSTRTGTLIYTGAGETTNKFFNLAGPAGAVGVNPSGEFQNNGTGPLVFTGTAFVVHGGANSLRLFRIGGTNTDDNDIQPAITDNTSSGTVALIKAGSGFWKLSGANTYSGSTSIFGGRLTVGPTGSLANTSVVTINGPGAELRWNSATTMSRPLTFTQGTISGTGAIGVAVTVGANRVLSPGNSPGNQPYTAGLTLATSGTYVWEIASGTGTKGVDWDLITVSGGSLNLSTLGSGSTFNLNLVTLSGTSAGAMANYTAGNAYRWRIFDATSLDLPSSFSSFLVATGTYTAFTDVTSLFTLGTNGWQNPALDMTKVTVQVAANGTGMDLVIVPEPSALVIVAGGLGGVAFWHRRRRRAV